MTQLLAAALAHLQLSPSTSNRSVSHSASSCEGVRLPRSCRSGSSTACCARLHKTSWIISCCPQRTQLRNSLPLCTPAQLTTGQTADGNEPASTPAADWGCVTHTSDKELCGAERTGHTDDGEQQLPRLEPFGFAAHRSTWSSSTRSSTTTRCRSNTGRLFSSSATGSGSPGERHSTGWVARNLRPTATRTAAADARHAGRTRRRHHTTLEADRGFSDGMSGQETTGT